MGSNYRQGWLDPRLDPRGYRPEVIAGLREIGGPVCTAAADMLEKFAMLPLEPTREIINAMDTAFYGEHAVEITGPDDPVGKLQWREWANVYAAILAEPR